MKDVMTTMDKLHNKEQIYHNENVENNDVQKDFNYDKYYQEKLEHDVVQVFYDNIPNNQWNSKLILLSIWIFTLIIPMCFIGVDKNSSGLAVFRYIMLFLFNVLIVPVCLYVLKYFISNKPINQQYLDKVTVQIKKQFSSNDEIVLKGTENYNEDIKQVMRKVLKVQNGKEQKQIISYQDIKDLYKIYSNKFKQVENDFNKKYEIEKQSKLIHKCLDDF